MTRTVEPYKVKGPEVRLHRAVEGRIYEKRPEKRGDLSLGWSLFRDGLPPEVPLCYLFNVGNRDCLTYSRPWVLSTGALDFCIRGVPPRLMNAWMDLMRQRRERGRKTEREEGERGDGVGER